MIQDFPRQPGTNRLPQETGVPAGSRVADLILKRKFGLHAEMKRYLPFVHQTLDRAS